MVINPATIYTVFSHREPARGGLPLDINLSGASDLRRLGVAALANGTTITCAPRLNPAQI